MEEPRRIDLISNVGMNLDKTKDTEMPTIRLNIQLPESTDQKCPEFLYCELSKNLMERSEACQIDPTDPFAVKDQMEHDNMLAIAKNFEMKYGNQPGKKKHRSLVEDFVDLGEGYEEDSFVDNSEAYDELVPSTMTTKLGGFYINCGTLDFVSLDEISLDGEPLKKKDKKRNVIESDNEGNENSENKKKLYKIKENGSGKPMKKKHKQVLLVNMKKGKHCKDPPGRVLKTETSMIVAEIFNQANCAPMLTTIKPPPPTSLPVSLPLTSSHLGPLSTPTTTIAETSQNLLLNPVRKMTSNAVIEKSFLPPPPPLLPPFPTISRSVSIHANSLEIPAEKNKVNRSKIESSIESVILKPREEEPKSVDVKSEGPQHVLPESLPPRLLKALTTIKDMAAVKPPSDERSAGLRFTPDVQMLLREIYDHVQKLSSIDRLSVYSNLALYFPCGKEALIKRLKKLNLSQHDEKLKQPINNLKDAIQKVMPSLIEKHQVEVSAKEKQRLHQIQEIKERKVEPKEQSDSEEDDDVGERQRRIVAPRKKFEFNAEIRNYLCNVVDIKMEYYEMSKIRSQMPEDYLKGFLESQVKLLWPTGWMQTRCLRSKLILHLNLGVDNVHE